MNRYGSRYRAEYDPDRGPGGEERSERRAGAYGRPGSGYETRRPGENWRTWGQGGVGEPWQRGGSGYRERWEGRREEDQPPFRGYGSYRRGPESYDTSRGYPAAYNRGYDLSDPGDDERYEGGDQAAYRPGYRQEYGGEYGRGYPSWRDFDDRGHMIRDEEDRFLRLYGGPEGEREHRSDIHDPARVWSYGRYDADPEEGESIGDGTLLYGRGRGYDRAPSGDGRENAGYGDRYPDYRRGSSRDWLLGREESSRRGGYLAGANYRGNYGESYGTGMADYARSGGPYGYQQGSRSYGSAETQASGPYAGRGPRGYRRSDERIREDVCQQLYDHVWMDAHELSVEVEDGEVTLHGDVDGRDQKRLAEEIAEQVMGVRDVHNRLKVHEHPRSAPEEPGGEPRILPGAPGAEDMMGVSTGSAASPANKSKPATGAQSGSSGTNNSSTAR